MKRTLMIAAALASLAFVSAPSPSQAASVGISVRIGDPYRGAALHFRSEPDYVVVPGTQVYYMDDDYGRDFYRYGGWYYMVDEGYWYRARSYRGPFIRIDYRSVPRQFTYVPTRYRRHWGSSSTYFRYRGGDYGDRYYQGDRYQGRTYRTRDRYNGDNGDRYRRDGNWDNRDRNWDNRDRSYRTRDRNWDWDRNRDRRDDGDHRSGRDGRYRDRNRGDNQDDNGDQNDDQDNDGRRDRGN